MFKKNSRLRCDVCQNNSRDFSMQQDFVVGVAKTRARVTPRVRVGVRVRVRVRVRVKVRLSVRIVVGIPI